MFNKENEPSEEQMRAFVGSELWDELGGYLREKYGVKPKLTYSSCAMDGGFWKGWHVKYKKGGRALCTLYPKEGVFFALVVVGEREAAEAEAMMSVCDKYTRELYGKTEACMGGKWLVMEVKNEKILRDVKNLVALKVN